MRPPIDLFERAVRLSVGQGEIGTWVYFNTESMLESFDLSGRLVGCKGCSMKVARLSSATVHGD